VSANGQFSWDASRKWELIGLACSGRQGVKTELSCRCGDAKPRLSTFNKD
jgi:hypothetical protein